MNDLKRNAVKCLSCQQEIESKYRYNFVQCKCGAISVDGGLDYLRRVGQHDAYEELSEDEGGLISRHLQGNGDDLSMPTGDDLTLGNS